MDFVGCVWNVNVLINHQSYCWPEGWVTKAALWLLTRIYILSANPTRSRPLWRISQIQRNSLCTSIREGQGWGWETTLAWAPLSSRHAVASVSSKWNHFAFFPLSIWKTADWWNLMVPQIVWHGWEDEPELSCTVKQLLDKLFREQTYGTKKLSFQHPLSLPVFPVIYNWWSYCCMTKRIKHRRCCLQLWMQVLKSVCVSIFVLTCFCVLVTLRGSGVHALGLKLCFFMFYLFKGKFDGVCARKHRWERQRHPH